MDAFLVCRHVLLPSELVNEYFLGLQEATTEKIQ